MTTNLAFTSSGDLAALPQNTGFMFNDPSARRFSTRREIAPETVSGVIFVKVNTGPDGHTVTRCSDGQKFVAPHDEDYILRIIA